MKRTNIHLTEQQRSALRELAVEYRRTPAEMVRRAIDFYVEYCTGRKIKDSTQSPPVTPKEGEIR